MHFGLLFYLACSMYLEYVVAAVVVAAAFAVGFVEQQRRRLLDVARLVVVQRLELVAAAKLPAVELDAKL